MNRWMRRALFTAILGLLLFSGWRVVGQMQAERHAQAEPERALRWRSDHPGALLVLVADSVVRILPFVTELRLGIALSLLGAPFFLWLLLRMRRGLV